MAKIASEKNVERRVAYIGTDVVNDRQGRLYKGKSFSRSHTRYAKNEIMKKLFCKKFFQVRLQQMRVDKNYTTSSLADKALFG